MSQLYLYSYFDPHACPFFRFVLWSNRQVKLLIPGSIKLLS